MFATLDGYLMEEDSGAGWTYISGTAPHIRTFEIDADAGQRLFSSGTIDGSTLILDSRAEGLGVERIEKLTILNTLPTSLLGTVALTVADLRWQWRYPTFKRGFNIRENALVRRRLPGIPLAVAPIEDDVLYATLSLNQATGNRWSGDEVLEEVLNEIAGADGWKREKEDTARNLPRVEGLDLDGKHDRVVGDLLAYFGLALDVWVDSTGMVILTNRLTGDERQLVGAPSGGGVQQGIGGTRVRRAQLVNNQGIGSPYEGTPLWAVQDRRRERPSKIIVESGRSMEIRADFVEEPEGDTALVTRARSPNQVVPPKLQNLVILPEDATINGEDLVESSYADLKGYIDFLIGQQPPGLPPLTLKLLRTAWFAPAVLTFSRPGIDITGIWGRRIQRLREGYRGLVQLDKIWRDRVENIEPYRVGLLSTETRARGPATIYTDYAEVSLWRWVDAIAAGRPPEEDDIVRNRFAVPPTGGPIVGTPIENMEPASAELTVRHQDQGIFQITFARDFTGQVALIAPSAMESEEGLPSDDPAADNQWLAYANLSERHEISIVFTASLKAPNDSRQFHRQEVLPEDVAQFFPDGGVGPAEGPVWHVRIPQSDSVARFPWDDSRADQIYAAMAEGLNSDLTDALGDPGNFDEVKDVAIAEAAKVWASFQDHVEGGLTTAFKPGARLRGSTRSLSHEFVPGPTGGAITIANFPNEPQPIGSRALLTPTARRIVDRLVEP